MKTITSIFILIASTITAFHIASPAARSDRGMISFTQATKLFEPGQNAIAAWNGEEEILVLSTNVHASADTDVLEVLPLPAEPKVTQGEVNTFERVQKIYDKVTAPSRATASKMRGLAPVQAGKMTFHQQIGSHDITVFQALYPNEFVEWVEKELKSLGSATTTIPEWMRPKIKEYIEEGSTWFVFDSVHLTTQPRSSEPIRYRFKTRSLFYPMRITKVEGPSIVNVMAVTSEPLEVTTSTPEWSQGPDIKISGSELKFIDPEFAEMLESHVSESIRLQKWNAVAKPGAEFDRDLVKSFKPPKVKLGI